MSRWYLDENDIDVYLKCTDDVRWNYSPKELVRILNDLETKLGDMEQEQIKEMQEHQEAMELANKTINNLIEDNRASQEWYKQQLAEKEKEIERWHNNYKQRDRQFQSVRQRYHLLNRLQANYHDKHKLHLSEMQCLELIEENEKLHQDKISFAVEKLEETRKLIANLDMPDSPVLYNDDMFQAGFDSHYVRTRQTIDNQIEELKKEMNNV